MRLIGDIGGTNARFALQRRRGSYREVAVLKVADFAGPAEAIRHYLGGRRVREAVLAVATPVLGDHVRFTNSPWSFSRSGLAGELGLERLAVINDFVAQALAVPHLEADDLEPIGGGTRQREEPAIVAGPGTGLGAAILLHVRGRPSPVASEAGHMSFAPVTARERALLAALAAEHGHVSYERIVSGPGMLSTARALAALDGAVLDVSTPEEVTLRAAEGRCAHCAEALTLFSGALGAFAGDLALTVLARGGVFMVGALLSGLGGLFDRALFRRRFEDKGRLSTLLAGVPVFRVVRAQTGLLGASWYSFR